MLRWKGRGGQEVVGVELRGSEAGWSRGSGQKCQKRGDGVSIDTVTAVVVAARHAAMNRTASRWSDSMEAWAAIWRPRLVLSRGQTSTGDSSISIVECAENRGGLDHQSQTKQQRSSSTKTGPPASIGHGHSRSQPANLDLFHRFTTYVLATHHSVSSSPLQRSGRVHTNTAEPTARKD